MRMMLFGLALAGCSASAPAPEPAPPAETSSTVVVTSQPLAWVVSELLDGGESTVLTLAPTKATEGYRPTTDQVVEAQKASVILTSGAGYEGWLATSSLPSSRLVDTSKGIDLVKSKGVSHSHGEEDAHSHMVADPSVWSDPALLDSQRKRVEQALVSAYPSQKAQIAERSAALGESLTAASKVWTEILPKVGETYVVALGQPGFVYLAKGYGLDAPQLDIDPTAPLSGERLHEIEHWAEDQTKPTMIWWSTQPSSEFIDSWPMKNTTHVVLRSLEFAGEGQGDYLEITASNQETLQTLLGGAAPDATPHKHSHKHGDKHSHGSGHKH